MKINLTKGIRDRSLIAHIIIESMVHAINKDSIIDKVTNSSDKDNMVDMVLSINGEELNFEHFVKNWENQVDHQIKEQAKGLLAERFADIINLSDELSDRIQDEVAKRMDFWEVFPDEKPSLFTILQHAIYQPDHGMTYCSGSDPSKGSINGPGEPTEENELFHWGDGHLCMLNDIFEALGFTDGIKEDTS